MSITYTDTTGFGEALHTLAGCSSPPSISPFPAHPRCLQYLKLEEALDDSGVFFMAK